MSHTVVAPLVLAFTAYGAGAYLMVAGVTTIPGAMAALALGAAGGFAVSAAGIGAYLLGKKIKSLFSGKKEKSPSAKLPAAAPEKSPAPDAAPAKSAFNAEAKPAADVPPAPPKADNAPKAPELK